MANMNLDCGFLIMYDWWDAFEELSNEDFRELLTALVAYQRNGTAIPRFESEQCRFAVKMIQPFIKKRLDGSEFAKKRKKESSEQPSSDADEMPVMAPVMAPIMGSIEAPIMGPYEQRREEERGEKKRKKENSRVLEEGRRGEKPAGACTNAETYATETYATETDALESMAKGEAPPLSAVFSTPSTLRADAPRKNGETVFGVEDKEDETKTNPEASPASPISLLLRADAPRENREELDFEEAFRDHGNGAPSPDGRSVAAAPLGHGNGDIFVGERDLSDCKNSVGGTFFCGGADSDLLQQLTEKGIPLQYAEERLERAKLFAELRGISAESVLADWWAQDRPRRAAKGRLSSPVGYSPHAKRELPPVGDLGNSFDEDDFMNAAIRHSMRRLAEESAARETGNVGDAEGRGLCPHPPNPF